jgi:hypothetical protein
MTDNNYEPIYSALDGKFGPNGCPQTDNFETYGYCDRFYMYGGYGNLDNCTSDFTFMGLDEASAITLCENCVHPSTGFDC